MEAMDAALEAGVTAIDTAPAYGNGHAEELVGKVLRGRRERAVIATKGGLNMERPSPKDLSPEFLEKDLHNSLKRLQTDYVDLYQCHWPDTQTPMERTMAALMSFREQGLIRNIGVCNFSAEQVLEAMKYAEIVSVQPQYSLLERKIEKDLLPLCLEKNLGVLSYGSLGAGVLSGKYKEPPQFGKGDARSFFYKFFKAQQWPSVSAVVDELRRIGNDRDAAPGHVAIAWILARQGITSAIVGARDPRQLRDNLKAMDVVLSADDIRALDEASKGF
jgi:aryl-alcohol dehydrogenase-like predicted oxidoreductase